ncbi:MAG: hypothetical protein KIT25_19720 [Enhydrobacter sp.]|nr:MAG: hypothetical protein KIT25_19720 [Enhydrobacter sp.]
MSTEGKMLHTPERVSGGAAGRTWAGRIADFVGPSSHRRTLAISALHVALIWLLAIVVVWQNRQHSIDTWKASAEKIALGVAAHAAQAHRAADLALAGIATLIDEQEIEGEAQFRRIVGSREFFQSLRGSFAGLPQVGMALVVAVDGEVLSSARQWPPAKATLAEHDAFRTAMASASGETVVGVPGRAEPDGTWRFYLVRRLASRSGTTLGAVAIGVDSAYFGGFFRSLDLGADGWISLFRADGTMLATSLPHEATLGRRFDDSLPHRMIQSGAAGEAVYVRDAGTEHWNTSPTRIVVGQKVEGFPAYVAVVIGESLYRWPLRTRNYFVVGIALLLTVLTVGAGLRILRLIERSDAARRAESERQVLDAIVEHPSALAAVVSSSGKVLHCNTRFRELLATAGKAADALFDPRLKGAETLLAFASGGAPRTGEVDLEYEPGEGPRRKLHFSLSRQSLSDTGDCTVMIGHDETQRHQAQQAIAMSARLVTLGEITTSIAHEISQPLNVIRMAAQNALVETAPTPSEAGDSGTPPMSDAEFRSFAASKFERIVAQVDRAADTLARMRIFSRKPGEEGHTLDVRLAFANALKFVLPQLRRDGIEVREHFPAGKLLARAPQTLMEQVLVYLLRNAGEALAESDRADRIIDVSAQSAAGGRVVLRVADNGPGVEPSIRERIFEPFFTTKPGDGNLGLGLALAFGAVRDAGGSLILLPGDEGATFQIELAAPGPPAT